jgi:hypothetical protein
LDARYTSWEEHTAKGSIGVSPRPIHFNHAFEVQIDREDGIPNAKLAAIGQVNLADLPIGR